MGNKARNTSGKFAAKSETPRKIRSVNLTDNAWQWLADVATQSGVSRNDYLEAMAECVPLMETVNTQVSPLMEMVKSDNTKAAEQPGNNVLPLMETVQSDIESLKKELEEVKADRTKLLESSTRITNKLREEVREVRSQLATEETRFNELGVELDNSEEIRGDIQAQLSGREEKLAELRSELSNLKQKSATAEKDLPEAADILDQLRKAKGKKFTASLADVESILGILEKS